MVGGLQFRPLLSCNSSACCPAVAGLPCLLPLPCMLSRQLHDLLCRRYEFKAVEGSPEAAASGVNHVAAAAPASAPPSATPKRKAPSGAAAADGAPASGGPASKRSRAAAAPASGGGAAPATVPGPGVALSTPGKGGAAGAGPASSGVDVDAMFKLNQANQVRGWLCVLAAALAGLCACMEQAGRIERHARTLLETVAHVGVNLQKLSKDKEALKGDAGPPCLAAVLPSIILLSLLPPHMQKLSKDKEALKGEVARLERELQQERAERKAAVAEASAAVQAQVGCGVVLLRWSMVGSQLATGAGALAALTTAPAVVQLSCGPATDGCLLLSPHRAGPSSRGG